MAWIKMGIMVSEHSRHPVLREFFRFREKVTVMQA